MSWLSQVTGAIARGEHDVAHAVTSTMEQAGAAEAGIARQLVNKARQLGNQLPGGMRLGNRVFGGVRTPMAPHQPNDLTMPHPSDYVVQRGSTQCGVEGSAGKPFVLNGFKALAAGAQTQGTDIVDFHAAASNPTIISTNDIIPGSVDIREASLSIAARAVTTLGFEGIGFFEQFYLIEYINGIEWARWSMRKLATMIGFNGTLGTAFGQANTYAINLPAIPFPRKYDPNTPYKTALQLSVTTTTVSVLDCSFVETGYRP